MNTFEKEISWGTLEFDAKEEKHIEVEKTKIATFKELNKLDRTQHKLHFKIMSLFEGLEKSKDEADSVGISSDGLYDITIKAINILLTPDENFTEMDKNEWLNDSLSLLNFGLWLFKEKFAPFFSRLKMN
jgi:hypothetical protein